MKITHRLTGMLAAAATAGALLTAGPSPAQAAPSGATAITQTTCCMRHHLEATLRGSSTYPAVRGHADYRSYYRHRELSVSIWHAWRLAGRRVTVFVHGTWVGTMRVWSDGRAHMYRGWGVPRTSVGDRIRIRTRSGTLVASGTFYRV